METAPSEVEEAGRGPRLLPLVLLFLPAADFLLHERGPASLGALGLLGWGVLVSARARGGGGVGAGVALLGLGGAGLAASSLAWPEQLWLRFSSVVCLVSLGLWLAFLPRWSRWLGPMAGVCVVSGLFVGANAALGLAPERDYGGDYYQNFERSHPTLGFRLRAPGTYRHTLRIGKESVFEATYGWEPEGRRRVPGSVAVATSHLVVVGCSWAYGEGLDDEETLAAQLAPRLEAQVYNYAFDGYGLQQVYAQVALEGLAVPQRSGALLYMALLPEHNERLLGSYHALKWMSDCPAYELFGGGLRTRGTFEEVDPGWVAWARFLRRSPALDWLVTRLDHSRSFDRSLELYVALCVETQRAYQSRFAGPFVVCLWPDGRDLLRRRASDRALTLLRSKGIEVLDLRDLLPSLAGYRIPRDGHPNARLHAVVAEALAERFGGSSGR